MERSDIAALGELLAWLEIDPVARKRFVVFYNGAARQLGVSKRLTENHLVAQLPAMLKRCSNSLDGS